VYHAYFESYIPERIWGRRKEREGYRPHPSISLPPSSPFISLNLRDINAGCTASLRG
jgi:hypothetical protein